MKILQITPRIPYPPNDGGAVYIYHCTKNLSELGHEVSLASFISNKHVQDEEHLSKLVKIFSIDGSFTSYSIASVIKSFLFLTPITIIHRMNKKKMESLLNTIDSNPEVILLEGLHVAAFIDIIRSIFPSVPIVLRQSNVEYLLLKRNAATTENLFLKLFYLAQYKLMKRFELTALKSVDAVTAITEFDKKVFLSDLPNLTCHVSPAGSEFPESLNIQRSSNKILSISNWKWKPNFDGLEWFLDLVWPTIVQSKPDVLLEIAGEGLSDTFKEKHQSNNINFLDFIDDLEPYKQSAAIFIAPLLSGSGMKLKIIEGLASSLPIVTTKFGAEGIEIEDGFHYLEANSASEFSAQTIKLMDSVELRNTLSKNAIKIVNEKYIWKEITQNLVSFLNETIKLYKKNC